MTLSAKAKSLIRQLAAMQARDLHAPIPPHSKADWDAVWEEVNDLACDLEQGE